MENENSNETHGVRHMSIATFNEQLRTQYKAGVVETNIYFDPKQARFRVKVGSKWRGSFYTLEGARACRATALMTDKSMAKSRVATDRRVATLKKALAKIVQKEQKARAQIAEQEARLKELTLEYNDTNREIGYLLEQEFIKQQKHNTGEQTDAQ